LRKWMMSASEPLKCLDEGTVPHTVCQDMNFCIRANLQIGRIWISMRLQRENST
jgi:hypothetical protein